MVSAMPRCDAFSTESPSSSPGRWLREYVLHEVAAAGVPFAGRPLVVFWSRFVKLVRARARAGSGVICKPG